MCCRAAGLAKAMKEMREGFERKPAVRVSKKLHAILDAMPGSLGRAVKGAVKRVAGR